MLLNIHVWNFADKKQSIARCFHCKQKRSNKEEEAYENVVMWDFCSVKLKNALVCLGVEGRGRAFLDLIETLSHKLGASILPVKGWGQRLPLSRSWWNSMVRVPHRCYGGRGFDFFLELWNLFSGSSDPLPSNHQLLSNYCFIESSALGISFFFFAFLYSEKCGTTKSW